MGWIADGRLCRLHSDGRRVDSGEGAGAWGWAKDAGSAASTRHLSMVYSVRSLNDTKMIERERDRRRDTLNH